jgi:hypothetical protein
VAARAGGHAHAEAVGPVDDRLNVARVERLHNGLRTDAVVAGVVDEPLRAVARRAREEDLAANGGTERVGGALGEPGRRRQLGRQRQLERAGGAEAEEGAAIEGHGGDSIRAGVGPGERRQ